MTGVAILCHFYKSCSSWSFVFHNITTAHPPSTQSTEIWTMVMCTHVTYSKLLKQIQTYGLIKFQSLEENIVNKKSVLPKLY